MRSGINRRQKNSRAATIDHAVELIRTHGVSYASKYLKNQRVTDETTSRILSDIPSARRALPRLDASERSWSKDERTVRQGSVRQLSYKAR